MQRLISKYGLAAHLALTAVAPLFLSPVASLYLAGLALVWMFMEPSRVGGEMLHDARRRVVRGVCRDPLSWVLLALVVIAGVRWMNSGVGLVYDAELSKWSISSPKFPLLPGCVDGAGFPEFVGAVVAMVVVVSCLHALGRAARASFLLLVSGFAGMGAAVYLYWFAQGSAEIRQIAACSLENPMFMGPIFGIALIAGVLGLVAVFEQHWYRSLLFCVFGVGGNAAGLFMFAPPLVALVYAGVAMMVFLSCFIYVRVKISRAADFRLLAVFGMLLTIAGVSVVAIQTDKELAARLAVYQTFDVVPERFMEMRDLLSNVGMQVWKQHPWIGAGLDTFTMEMQFTFDRDAWLVVSPLQKLPFNGYWRLLSERGCVGAFLLLVPLVLLLWHYVRGLIKGVSAHALPHPTSLAGLLVILTILTETMVDCTLFMPSVMVLVAALFAVASKSFPKEKKHG